MKFDPYWWEDAGRPTSGPETELLAEADIVVIGAGLTGLTAAARSFSDALLAPGSTLVPAVYRCDLSSARCVEPLCHV